MASAPPVSASPQGTTSSTTSRAHVNASPAAKNLARQLGVDLALVSGTGPGGRIGLEDVQRAADARTASEASTPKQPSSAGNDAQAEPLTRNVFPATGRPEAADRTRGALNRRVPLSKMRSAIAQRMAAALAAPQFTVHRQVDMTAALRVRQAHTAAGDRVPGVIDLIHLAVARALLAHPEVNASFHAGQSPEQSEIVLHAGVDLGIALALPDGLIVPVIRDAHTMGLQALAAERVRLQKEARAGRLAASAMGGATFTISNLGPLHVDAFTAIVTPPEVAILAVGQLQETLVVRDGAIHIVPRIALTVTADHRALDGAQVAYFLDTLAANLDRLETLQ
jgi:pyruvate dehydrogenase E2 component (dihydrolipoamide acetyltransferase)